MASPRNQRSDAFANVHRIVAAAREVFGREGDAATLSQVAAAAGVFIFLMLHAPPFRRGVVAAASYEACVRDGVVGRAERSLADEGARGWEHPGYGVDLGDFEHFVGDHGGEDGGGAACEEGFARAGRSTEKYVVGTCGGYFEGALDVLLAFYVAHVYRVLDVVRVVGEGFCLVGDDTAHGEGVVVEVHDQLAEGGYGEDVDASDEGCFGSILSGNVDALDIVVAGHGDHGKDACGVADCTVEAKLTQEDGACQVAMDVVGGGEYAEGYGQVVGRAFFAEVGGGEIDYDAGRLGNGAARVADG